MNREYLISQLNEFIGGYLEEQGLDLVELIYRYEGKNLVLRVLADKPWGGITLDECAALNNQIGRLLDEKDLLPERYTLEVCSPGLDRPLVTRKDFSRCLNKAIKVFLNGPIEGKQELEGVINRVEDDTVHLEIQGLIYAIPLLKIRKAKQVL